MALEIIEELTKAFNQKHNKRHDWKSEKLQNHFKGAFDEFGQENVVKVLALTKHSNIYDALNYFNILEVMENFDPKDLELKEEPKVEPAQPAEPMTLGLIEQALGQVILDKYVPQVTAKIDDYIKSQYGNIARQIDYVVPNKGKLENEVTHDEFETVLNFVMADEPVMLVGPAGTGKNVICQQVSKLLKLDFHFSNAVTQEYKLTGFIDAMGNYHETEFYKAFVNGGLFMLDEIDASIPEVLVILNAAIANRYFDFPIGRIDAHPDFRVIAAANTFGHGASYQYVGRNQLDGASLNRFAMVEIGYSKKIENSISSNVELVKFVQDFRKAVDKAGVNHIVSYRELGRMDKMLQTDMSLHKILQTCLIKNLEQDDLRMVVDKLDKSNKYSHEVASLC